MECARNASRVITKDIRRRIRSVWRWRTGTVSTICGTRIRLTTRKLSKVRSFVFVGDGLPANSGVFERVEFAKLVVHREEGVPVAVWWVWIGYNFRGFPEKPLYPRQNRYRVCRVVGIRRVPFSKPTAHGVPTTLQTATELWRADYSRASLDRRGARLLLSGVAL